MRIDLSLDKQGHCNGNVRLDGMGKLDIIKSAELVHFRGDAAYWRGAARERHTPQKQTDQMVATLADRWVKIPVSDPRAASMTGSCDLDKLTGDFRKGSPLARKGESTTVDGKAALAVTSPARQGTQTDYVATQGTPYILKSTVSGDTMRRGAVLGVRRARRHGLPAGLRRPGPGEDRRPGGRSRVTAGAARGARRSRRTGTAAAGDRTGPAPRPSPYRPYEPRIVVRNSPVQASSSRPTSGFPPTRAVFGRGTSTCEVAGLSTVPG